MLPHPSPPYRCATALATPRQTDDDSDTSGADHPAARETDWPVRALPAPLACRRHADAALLARRDAPVQAPPAPPHPSPHRRAGRTADPGWPCAAEMSGHAPAGA